MSAREINFDGLVGPTHNYSGLSYGNVASLDNEREPSNPKAAAKQGLLKMKAMHDMGVPQAVLPPHERPAVYVLRRLGFEGSDSDILRQAKREAPGLLASCCSASSMWTANAATVSPSADSIDSRVHFTPANLRSKFHRHIEVPTTTRVLQAIFGDPDYFTHHAWLPSVEVFGDEGAANHTRFTFDHGAAGVQLFVYGKRAFDKTAPVPQRFPARQTLEASQTVSRIHQLNPAQIVFAQQNPASIDLGVFHNDVISVGNQNVFFLHELAFVEQEKVLEELQSKLGSTPLNAIEVKNDQVSIEEAVATYLFNSQLVTLPEGGMMLAVPRECQESSRVWAYLERLLTEDHPIEEVRVFDLRQSMRNGGGPACLRLRVVLTDEELANINSSVLFTDELFEQLNDWVDRNYREQLSEDNLADPVLLEQAREALDEVTQILGLGSIYPFQQ